MGMKKINRWFKSLIHGYDLPQLKKSKPWSIMPSDKICILAPHACLLYTSDAADEL